MKFTRKLAVAAGLAATVFTITAAAATAGIGVSTAPGTNAPPPTLDKYKMSGFGNDARPLFGMVTTVPSPLGGSVVFDQALTHVKVGQGWGTWSHGYTGDVYHTASSTNPNQVTLTLPVPTKAFYFYTEPNAFTTHNVTATGRAADGSQVATTIPVTGFAGASYIGFFATAMTRLTTITVDVDPAAGGFAIGEFGIANGMLTKIT
jgi:hypothetical protein